MTKPISSLALLAVSVLFAAGQPPGGQVKVGRHYPQGVVTELTDHSIAVQCPGQLAKRFQVSDTLAAGKTPSVPRAGGRGRYHISPPDMYRLKDVQVGDWVCVIYAEVNGIEVCDHICIQKRPGGLVPQLPEDVFERDPLKYHERMNAYWDLEDRGIPYPEKFGLGRRWPIAPMPREVKRETGQPVPQASKP